QRLDDRADPVRTPGGQLVGQPFGADEAPEPLHELLVWPEATQHADLPEGAHQLRLRPRIGERGPTAGPFTGTGGWEMATSGLGRTRVDLQRQRLGDREDLHEVG